MLRLVDTKGLHVLPSRFVRSWASLTHPLAEHALPSRSLVLLAKTARTVERRLAVRSSPPSARHRTQLTGLQSLLWKQLLGSFDGVDPLEFVGREFEFQRFPVRLEVLAAAGLRDRDDALFRG